MGSFPFFVQKVPRLAWFFAKPELPVKTAKRRRFGMKSHVSKMGYGISEFPLDRFFAPSLATRILTD